MNEFTFLLDKLLPALNEGVVMSVLLIVPSALIGLGLGIVTGAVRAYGTPIMQRIGRASCRERV